MSSLIETEKLPIRARSSRVARRWSGAGLAGTLRGRLVAILMLTNFLALGLTGSVIVWKARTASQLEIDSSMRLAGVLVTDTIRLMNDAPSPQLLQTIALQFRAVRHVRIVVADAQGLHVDVPPARTPGGEEAAPAWFAALVAPPSRAETVPILRQQRPIGTATIASQPADEISEAWNYAEPLFVVGFALNMAALLALYLLYGRVLAPLAALAKGLEALQGKHYDVRLPLPALRELADLTAHFNRTAAMLAETSEGNRRLNRKLLTAQDDERRRMALELHDEVGPCLFALDANASSIVTLTGDADARVQARAERVVALVRQVKGINRRVLDQLRPIGLGHVALRESLEKLMLEFAGEAGPRIEASFGPLAESYGPVVDLTIYRCLQEGLFNAVRHAEASRITCAVVETRHSLEIRVADDGKGLAPAQRPRAGIGLAGMRERVEALHGSFDLATSAAGTRLTIHMPIGAERKGSAA